MSDEPGRHDPEAKGSASDTTENEDGTSPRREGSRWSRRQLLLGGGSLLGGMAIGAVGTTAVSNRSPVQGDRATSADAGDVSRVVATGEHQAGVNRPDVPASHALYSVLDAPQIRTREDLITMLAALGDRVRSLTESDSDLLPDGAGDLAVCIGVGARLVELVEGSTARVDLPLFAGDDALPPERCGGDMLIITSASDPGILEPVTAELVTAAQLTLRWSEAGYRGRPRQDVARNPFGFYDGVMIPRDDDALEQGVWIGSGAFAGGTICVVRHFDLDVDRFRELAEGDQEQIIGRHKADSSPLTGGDTFAESDLLAKTSTGSYVTPASSHVRAAHPSFVGRPLMLRRSYSVLSAGTVSGLLFTSFQNDVRTFAATQQRMDDMDAMMAYTTVRGVGAFAVLPGFDSVQKMGASL
ncbi:Dyp-type peroxidase [Pseudoclavibacter sp. 13-3]|uniref:Dyp-type peroxidase n=1 Tax=Pseudoclavibacter sp. 13-3 TaxID=2901228 RepID=UPI001E40C873|nr:Dyp-type peroxidase [Pseudoclavibacter sp. 13-3]